VITKLKKKKHP